MGRNNGRRMRKAVISGVADANGLALDLEDKSEEARGRSRVVRQDISVLLAHSFNVLSVEWVVNLDANIAIFRYLQ